MTCPVPESAVLDPRDPAITDSNDWPEFRLTDAYATLPGSRDQQPVSLLLASEHYPLTVTGRLAPPNAGQEHLWRRTDGGKKGTPVVIEDVRSFAYGSYADGSVDMWAAGRAGWFTIQPARAYRSMYHDMCAAVKMLFFVVDAYTEPIPKKKGKNVAQAWSEPSAQQVFERYAREELGDEARSAEAAEVVYRHRGFLLASMLAGKEGIAWARNPLYRHLARRFAADLRAIRERSAPPAQQMERSTSKALSHARHGSDDSASTSSSLKRKRGRPPKNKPLDVISIGSSSAASSMKEDLPQRPANSKTQKSKQAMRPLPAPSTRRTRNNSQSLPPRSATPEIQDSATPTQNSDSDSDDDDEDVPARSAGKGKSALRLKPSKPMKGPPRDPARSGKAPVQEDVEPRSSPIPSKRRRDEPMTNPSHRSKRRNSRAEDDEGIDIPSSPSTAAEEDTSAGASLHPSLADSLAARKPDPLQESTWLCALDGCTHKIYGDPSDPTSQRLIREHYALHAYDDDERVQLVKRLQAPSLPVGHLMERVRGVAKGEGFPGSTVAGTRFPEPLRTRY